MTNEAPLAVTAGVSAAELEVMREAAARLCAQPGGTRDLAGDDLFGALCAPFDPLPPYEWAGYQRHPSGHHFCVDGVLRAS
jgi:hypothetical protein